MRTDPPLVEPVHIPDVYVDGVARIDKLPGGNVRLIFYSENLAPDGSRERSVVCKLVCPTGCWPGTPEQPSGGIMSADLH